RGVPDGAAPEAQQVGRRKPAGRRPEQGKAGPRLPGRLRRLVVPPRGAQRPDRRRRSRLRQRHFPPVGALHELLPEARRRRPADLRTVTYVQPGQRLSESRNHYQMALWVILPASSVGLLLVCGLMRSFYSWVLNPIRDLEAGVRRVAGGDFTQRLEVHSGDEM